MKYIKNSKNTYKMFIKSNKIYSPFDGDVINELPLGIYKLIYNDQRSQFNLEYYDKEFSLPKDKIEIFKDYKDYIYESITNSTDNVGVLFTGEKGSGKTVIAKELCNNLNYPVILIDSFKEDRLTKLIEFLSSLKSDIIYMFDEFEKNFMDGYMQMKLLTFIDGVYNSDKYRKIFMLTANQSYEIIPEFYSRPSRILYKINFNSIDSMDEIHNIFKSKLIDNSDKVINKLLDFLIKKNRLNIDIILSVIKEVNRFGIDKFMKIGSNIINIENNEISCELEYYNSDSIVSIPFHEFIVKYLNNSITKSSTDYISITKSPTDLVIGDTFDGYRIIDKIINDKLVFLHTNKRGKSYIVIKDYHNPTLLH